jgi:hypothetical protein
MKLVGIPTFSIPNTITDNRPTAVNDMAVNPANEMIVYSDQANPKRIKYSIGGSASEKLTADLFDLRGNRIATRQLTSTSGEIDFNGIVSQRGLYILKISASKKQYSKVVFL